MTLYKVGSHQGADLELLVSLMKKNPACSIYAAGGVRNMSDLDALNKIAVAGALIASALHNQDLSSADIFHAKNKL